MFEPLCYECHITIDPVPENQQIWFDPLINRFGFRRAPLLMKKQGELVAHSSDAFLTAKAKTYKDIHDTMMMMLNTLHDHNCRVRRYKIEAVLVDSKV